MNKFVTKCDLHCNVKGYDGEKKAAFIAGRLDEPAFDIYMGLSAADQKDPEKIKAALLSSFDHAKRNREVAIEQLRHRIRLPDEKEEIFAHKILELVKYAYPKFDDDAKNSLAKDHYVKGLQPDIQKELRRMTDFENKTLTELVEQTTYLEIAGANSGVNNPSHETISEVSTAGPSPSNL